MINIVKEDNKQDNKEDNNKIYYNMFDKNTNKKIIECKLNKNIFNPTKNSPINNWQNRLLKRINDLDNLDLLKLDSFKLHSLNSN